MKAYVQLGTKIYNNNRFSDYRRMVPFIIRSLTNHKKMQELIGFFQLNSLRCDIINAYPSVFEQVTRCIFYRNSTFTERMILIQEHFLFFEAKFTQEALQIMYLREGIRLWNRDYQGENLSLDMHFCENHKKEGLMGIALQLGEKMIYQIIFWVAPNKSGEMAIHIGTLQGSPGGLDIARDLTRFFLGYRPKNLILQALRVLAEQMGIHRIYAVSNYGFYANNHIRLDRKLKTSLDEFWQETSGKDCGDPRFFELPVVESRKSLDEVQSKKRNLYRKRFAAIDEIDVEIKQSLELYMKKI
ncbi:VirK/YbjX family protein [Pelosinus sp. sgz500959]|uniref:VirK/YbjX family protein n=1 Tax=Pelosinus sp. sgz500959 TaxID=3242472 RepID=UPI003671F68E